jgi:glycosyltransferase involved in cell wall biosynthesis
MNVPLISIVSPVYKARNIIPELVAQIEKSVLEITGNFEIILVDDGCPENSWEIIEEIAKNNHNVIGIKSSRNFGQHYAISAGLSEAKGEWIVVMDCDLQDRPDEIPKLYNKALEGFDIVLAQRIDRRDNYLKKLFSYLFYKFLGYLTGSMQDGTVANFGIYHRKVIKTVVNLTDSIRFFPSMIKWVGFKSVKLPVEHSERMEGVSSYNFKRLLKLAFDIVLAYTDKPLRIVVKMGLLISLSSLLVALYFGYKYFKGEIIVDGYTSLIISIWLLSGIVISILGMLGLYIGKIFEQTKNRPNFIIDKKLNG